MDGAPQQHYENNPDFARTKLIFGDLSAVQASGRDCVKADIQNREEGGGNDLTVASVEGVTGRSFLGPGNVDSMSL